jgi:hypothetical protein
MMKQALMYSLLLIGSLSFLSCSKSDDDDNNSGNNASALITASTWKYSDAGLDMNSDGVKDSGLPPGVIASCDTDNTITFKSDNTGVLDEGATRCNASNPQTVPFTWSLKNNGAEINFSTPLFPGINGDLKVIELTATKFTFSKVINTTISGIPVTANVIVFLTH